MPGIAHAQHGLNGHLDPADMPQAVFHLRAFEIQLRRIGHMLAYAAAALFINGTRRIDAQR